MAGLFGGRGVNPTAVGSAPPVHQAPPAQTLDLWVERHELPLEVPPRAEPEPEPKVISYT